MTKFTRGTGYWSTYAAPTEESSQRENWYAISPYMGEFWCAVTSLPIIVVGVYQMCPPLVFAGLASFMCDDYIVINMHLKNQYSYRCGARR